MFAEMLHTLRARNLHHAYCIEGVRRTDAQIFTDAVRTTFNLARGDTNCISVSYGTFGIDEAHALDAWAAHAPAGDAQAHKFFIIAADTYTPEAQQALLKRYEEPSPRTHFFLLVPHAALLLPTLRSRLEVVSVTRGAHRTSADTADARTFLAAAPRERLAHVEKLVRALKEERVARSTVHEFIAALLARARGAGVCPRARAAALRELVCIEQYEYDRSASFKLLLEHAAVVLPRIS